MLTGAQLQLQSCVKALIVSRDINYVFFFSTMDFVFHLLEQRTFILPDVSRLDVLKMCCLDAFSKLERVTSFKAVVSSLPVG